MDLLAETSALSLALDRLPPPRGVAAVLNPLRYAWSPHRRWLLRHTDTGVSIGGHCYAGSMAARRRVLIVGMNPGPHGMCQTGLPFGDVVSARRILGLAEDYEVAAGVMSERVEVLPAARFNPDPFAGSPRDVRTPRRFDVLPVEAVPTLAAAMPAAKGKLVRRVNGFAHKTVEESGRRLWGLLEDMWGGLDALLADVFVMNMVPLAYFSVLGENLTPPDLDREDCERVLRPCLAYFRAVVRAMRPEVIVGVGRWSESQCLAGITISDANENRDAMLLAAPDKQAYRVIYLPHPSPRGGSFAGWVKEAARVLAPYAPGAT